MPDDQAGLARIQRRMQQALLSPSGPPDSVRGLVTGSSRLDPRERFVLYWRGYRLRLLDTMCGLYPALCHLLGRPLFDRFALDYLDEHPPGSPSLFRLGDGFAAHLARTRPDADQRRELWPDLMIDLAGFEQVFAEVLDGPGPETGPVLAGADLPGFAAGTWPDVTLTPVIGLRLVAARFPVHGYAGEVRGGEHPDLPAPRPTYLVVHRRDYRVVVGEHGAAAHRALRSLTEGATVRAALAAADPATAEGWLSGWAGSGLFTALGQPADPIPAGLDSYPNMAGRNTR
jgi:hypothetical protein